MGALPANSAPLTMAAGSVYSPAGGEASSPCQKSQKSLDFLFSCPTKSFSLPRHSLLAPAVSAHPPVLSSLFITLSLSNVLTFEHRTFLKSGKERTQKPSLGSLSQLCSSWEEYVQGASQVRRPGTVCGCSSVEGPDMGMNQGFSFLKNQSRFISPSAPRDAWARCVVQTGGVPAEWLANVNRSACIYFLGQFSV